MTLHVVYAQRRHAPGPGQAAGKTGTDQQGPDQARPPRVGDRVDLGQFDPDLVERELARHTIDAEVLGALVRSPAAGKIIGQMRDRIAEVRVAVVEAKAAIEAAGPGKVFAEVFDMASGPDAYKAWLEKAAGELGGCDIFVKIAGGGRVDDPAADLAITAALTVALFIYSAPVYELESQLVRGQP